MPDLRPALPWWPHLRARADRPPLVPRLPLRIDGRVVGSIAAPMLQAMREARLPVLPTGDLAADDATAALARIADWLRKTHRAGGWRDELLAVREGGAGPALANVERGVARNLGIHTSAVQLHARAGDSNRWWLQQRALDKATDPGGWDTLMGGLVSAGESIEAALQREAWEEAGIRLHDLEPPARPHGTFTVRRPVDDAGSHGYLVETVHAFSCTLDAAQVPANLDGEVLRFDTFAAAQIDGIAADGRLTLEAAVAIALCADPGLGRAAL